MTPRDLGQAAVLLWQSGEKQAADASISYGLKGKLHLSHSGWLLLTVPNDLGVGAFKALNAPGAEMPFSSSLGRYNAHISVMRPEEVQQIGADNINERGKELSFTLGPVRECDPAGWEEMDRVWFIECRSPDLEKLRKSYGLSALPKGGDYQFHITFAVRRRKVLRPGDAIKKMTRGSIIHRPAEFMKASSAVAVNRNQDSYWDSPPNKDGRKCPGCGELFKECEPLKGVVNCEVCERYGPARSKESAARGVEIRESAIDGKGLFATRNYEPGEIIVSRAMAKLPGNNGLTNYEQSDESRFTNHSREPNLILRKGDDWVDFVAARPIVSGEEITGDYNACSSVLGPGFYFSHRGKDYTGESTSGRDPEDDGYLAAVDAGEEAAGGAGSTSGGSDGDITEALRAIWDSFYDPVRGSGGDRDDSSRPREIGSHSEGAPAPGLDGTDAELPGSLHDLGAQVDQMAKSGTARGKEVDPRRASRTQNTVYQLLRLGDEWGSQSKQASSGNGVLQRTHGGAFCGAGTARDTCAVNTPAGLSNSDTQVHTGRGRTADLAHGFTLGVGYGLTQNEKEAAVAGATLAQQIAVARRQTKAPTSDLQAEAGNYPKGKVVLHGLTVAIETGKGSTRSGTAPNGKTWSIKMQHDYGYIHRTTGKDGDHVDVFIGPDPDVEAVWVVNQYVDGKFDEHKCMLGFKGQQAAREGYLSNYEDNWQGLESMVGMTMEQFKDWIKNGDQTKPVKPYTVKKAGNWGTKVDDLLFRRDPEGISGQQWDVALRATPIQYDLNVNPLTNILNHAGKIQSHGRKQIAQQSQHERLLNAADPDRAIRKLQADLAGGGNHGRVPGQQFSGQAT